MCASLPRSALAGYVRSERLLLTAAPQPAMAAAVRRFPTIGVGATIMPRWRIHPGLAIVGDSVAVLIQRASPPGAGLWCVPGGRAEWGERIAAAAMRETWEEVQVRAVVDDVDIPGFATTDVVAPATAATAPTAEPASAVAYHYGIVHVLAYLDMPLPSVLAGWGTHPDAPVREVAAGIAAARQPLPALVAHDDAGAAEWFAINGEDKPSGISHRANLRTVAELAAAGVLVDGVAAVLQRAQLWLRARATVPRPLLDHALPSATLPAPGPMQSVGVEPRGGGTSPTPASSLVALGLRDCGLATIMPLSLALL